MKVTSSITLDEPLGRGAMGSVWIADHAGLKTKVAVKLIAADALARHRVLRDRFAREAELAAKIKSPHVAQIFDHGETEDGVPYIVMELLDGETLSEHIKRNGPLDVKDAALMLRQIAQALGRAHALGVVHRDIKPANVMLIDTGYDLFVKVLDFGIAKASEIHADGLTMTGEVMGSPLYMSPEQFGDTRNVDTRADLWSAASTLFEALTGACAFEGRTVLQVMKNAHLGNRRKACELRPELPAGVDVFFDTALHPDIDARYQDAASLAAGFDPDVAPKVIADEPTEALPIEDVSVPTSAPPWKLGVATVIVVAAIVVFFPRGDPVTAIPVTAPSGATPTVATTTATSTNDPVSDDPVTDDAVTTSSVMKRAAPLGTAAQTASAATPAAASASASTSPDAGELYNDEDLTDPKDLYDDEDLTRPNPPPADLYDDKDLSRPEPPPTDIYD